MYVLRKFCNVSAYGWSGDWLGRIKGACLDNDVIWSWVPMINESSDGGGWLCCGGVGFGSGEGSALDESIMTLLDGIVVDNRKSFVSLWIASRSNEKFPSLARKYEILLNVAWLAFRDIHFNSKLILQSYKASTKLLQRFKHNTIMK